MDEISKQIVYVSEQLLETIHWWEATHEICYKIELDKQRKRLQSLIEHWHDLEEDLGC